MQRRSRGFMSRRGRQPTPESYRPRPWRRSTRRSGSRSWRDRLMPGKFSHPARPGRRGGDRLRCGRSTCESRTTSFIADLYVGYCTNKQAFCGIVRTLCTTRMRAGAEGPGGPYVGPWPQNCGSTDFGSLLVWVLAANPAVSFYEHLGGTLVAQKTIQIGGATLPEIALYWPDIGILRRRQLKSTFRFPFQEETGPHIHAKRARARAG